MPRPPAWRWVPLAGASVAMMAACGTGDAGDAGDAATSDPARPAAVTAASAPARPTSEATDPTVPSAARVRDALPVGAGAGEIATAANDVLGPTDDAVAGLAPFVDVPADIPTPRGARVTAFTVWLQGDAYFKNESAEDYGAKQPILVARSELTVEVDAELDDLATFYEAEMAAAGYSVRSSSAEDGNGELRELEFRRPEDTFEWSRIEVSIFDGAASDDNPVSITVTISDKVHRRDALARIDGWPGPIPAVPERETVDVWIQAPPNVVATGGPREAVVRLRVAYRVPGTLLDETLPQRPIDELRRAITSGLPAHGYRRREVADPTTLPSMCQPDDPAFTVGNLPLNKAVPVQRDGLRNPTLLVQMGIQIRPTELENAIYERTYLGVQVCALAGLP